MQPTNQTQIDDAIRNVENANNALMKAMRELQDVVGEAYKLMDNPAEYEVVCNVTRGAMFTLTNNHQVSGALNSIRIGLDLARNMQEMYTLQNERS